MDDENLGPIPEPKTEEPELHPGGTDALYVDPADDGLGRDLDPDDNPAVDDVLPDGIAEPDDKQQEPDGSKDEESDTTAETSDGGTSEPRAGQQAEDGSPEPPA